MIRAPHAMEDEAAPVPLASHVTCWVDLDKPKPKKAAPFGFTAAPAKKRKRKKKS